VKRSFKTFMRRLESGGLLEEVSTRARLNYVTLEELYDGPNRAPSIAAARKAVYKWLLKNGKGLNEVSRIFDRNPSGVAKLVGRNGTTREGGR